MKIKNKIMRRITIIDDSQTNLNPAQFAGLGLGNFVFVTSQFFGKEVVTETLVVDKSGNSKLQKVKSFVPPTLTDIEVANLIGNLGPGDGVMLVGADCFAHLRNYYHFGIRGENFYDCSKLRRVSIEGGAFAKCIVDYPDKDQIDDFMSEDFTKPRDYSWFKQKIIHTYDESCQWISYMDHRHEGTNFGFDYESSGMPWDYWFELSGFALCDRNEGAFISLTDLRHTATKEQYDDFLYNHLAMFFSCSMS